MPIPDNAYHGDMTLVSAHDAARELRRRLPNVGTVKIHKLLYFAQGLHLGLTGEPIFRERIEAWTMGPVVADFWHDEDKGREAPAPGHLSDSALSVIDEVVRRFAATDGRGLIRLTHSDGGPWCQVTEMGDEYAPQSQPIPPELMAAWFEKDDVITAHRETAERLAAHRRGLDELDAASSGLLDALERISMGESFCDSRPI